MRLLALVIAFLLLSAPVAMAAGAPSTTTPSGTSTLSTTAPWLTQTATTAPATTTAAPVTTTAVPATTTAEATTPAVTPTTSPPITTPRNDTGGRGDLPYTGDDLLPESIVAVGLLAGGVLLRLRWRRPDHLGH